MALAHKFDEAKVKRDKDGQFAKKAFTGGPSWLKAIKGKQPPKSFKFYKPGYSPKAKGSITGVNASSDGKTLWEMKKAGAFDNDYEFWLAAGKLAAAYKKNHGSNAATPHSIVNMAFHHEMEETKKPPVIGSYAKEMGAPTGGKSNFELGVDEKHTYAKTSGGLQVKSKYLAPGDLVPTGKKMSGVNGALVYKDAKGQEWLVKFPGGSKGTSQAYSNSLFLVDLDVATSRIQSKAGLPVPSINAKMVDGKMASVHKMYSGVSDAFPSHNPKLSLMDDADIVEIQKNMVLDWVLSNHDPHSGNFLKTRKGIIGIDKGQSFKYFGKDKLTINYGSDLNPPLAPNKPVYSTLMKQAQEGKGDMDFNHPEVQKTIQRIQAIPDDEYKALLRPYAEKARKQGLLNYPGKSYGDTDEEAVAKFLQAAVDRKNNLGKDFDALNKVINPPKAAEPSGPATPKVSDLKEGDIVELHDGSLGTIKQVVTWGDTPNLDYAVGHDSDGKTFKVKPFNMENGTVKKVDKTSIPAPSAPEAPKKLKLEDELAKDMSAVEVGDYLKYKGGTSVEVVGVSPHSVSLANGQLIGATDFDMGFIDWGAKPPPKDDIGKGYAVVQDGNTLKWKIKKPTGEFSKNKNGDEKTWDSKEEALASSTAAKYKAQAAQQEQYAAQQLQSQLAGAVSEATSAPDNDPNTQLKGAEALEYTQLKQKIMSGQHTPDDYAKFKTLKSKLLNSKKAEGAAQVEDDFDGGFVATAPAPAAPKKAKGGFKETPKFKLKGGAPPEISQAKGPNAVTLGEQLWAMKKAGQITDDYQMWNAANKLSNADKKAALAKNPNAVVGVDYSSKNAIRNVAMRLEFDETGDVAWSSAEELTSSEVGQTVAEIKKSLTLQDHVPVKPASASHHFSPHFSGFGTEYDSSKPVGSYQNPHSFKHGDTQAVNAYGYKYTDHNNWDQGQKSAWYSFSGSGSGSINTFFRTGDVGMYGNIEHTKKQAKNIVDAFKSKNVKPLDDWTTVVRGTSGGWELGIGADVVSFEDMKAMEGKVVRNKCPVSSSLRDRPPWGSYRITYKLPPGFPMLALLGKSAHPGEQEVLLPPGMAYRIKQVNKGTGGYQHEVLVEVVDVKLPEIA